jgi:CRISPR-associated protein Cmr1
LAHVEITLSLTTPAFAGGAGKEKTDGIRPPTVKALLRFWWRTMHGHLPPDKLFEAESTLFGSTSRQGLRVVPRGPVRPPDTQVEDAGQPVKAELAYLGYGPVVRVRGEGNRTQVERLPCKTTMRFHLVLPPGGNRDELLKALWLMSAFGGIGSRSRRGWGSVKVTPEGGWGELPDLARTPAALVAGALTRGLAFIFGDDAFGKRGKLPEWTTVSFTAFSRDTELVAGPAFADDMAAHQGAADMLRAERQSLGCAREDPARCQERHGTDHDAVYELARQAKRDRLAGPIEAPKRAAYGLPHPYFLQGLGGDDEQKRASFTILDGNQEGRRASPLFVKVLHASDGYVPLLLWLKAPFLPSGQVKFRTHWRDYEVNPVTDTSSLTSLFNAARAASGWTGVL